MYIFSIKWIVWEMVFNLFFSKQIYQLFGYKSHVQKVEGCNRFFVKKNIKNYRFHLYLIKITNKCVGY